MLIYVKNITERLTYTLDFIFKERDLKYQTTNNLNLFEKSQEPKLNYSDQTIANTVQIKPSPILFNSGIEYKEYLIKFFALCLTL